MNYDSVPFCVNDNEPVLLSPLNVNNIYVGLLNHWTLLLRYKLCIGLVKRRRREF